MLPKARAIDPRVIKVPTALSTARLRLLKPSPSMAKGLAGARIEGYASLYPWFHEDMGTRAEEADVAWQEARIAKQINDFEARKLLSYYAFDGDEMIGMVGLLPIWRRGQFKLSYWIRPAAQRKGYGMECVGAIVVFAFQALDARLVTTGHAEPNIGSARLAQRLGFAQVARQPLACEMPDETLVAGIGYAVEDDAHLRSHMVKWH